MLSRGVKIKSLRELKLKFSQAFCKYCMCSQIARDRQSQNACMCTCHSSNASKPSHDLYKLCTGSRLECNSSRSISKSLRV